MKDLTSTIKNAMSQDVLWSVNDFFQVIKILENSYEVSFWENEENWGTILNDNTVIGYLWQKYPVFFVTKVLSEHIQSILTEYPYLHFVASDNLEKEEFSLDYDNFQDILEYGLNYKRFSATDLWFQTNSR